MYTACHIGFIKPPGYEGSLVFREMLFLLRNSIQALGIDCTMAGNQLDAGRLNIVIGYHLLKFDDALAAFDYIPYQLEQLDHDNSWFNEGSLSVLHGAAEIWDFSPINISFLRDQGLEAKLLPVGFHPSLTLVEHRAEKDIDVLFYGSINERRKVLLEQLSKCCRVEVLQGVFGEQRDAVIARSRIVLNMHYYPTRIMETVRLSWLINNGCFVISEKADDDPWPRVDLVTAPYETLIDTCLDWLKKPEETQAHAVTNQQQALAHYDMAVLLDRVLRESELFDR